LQTTTSGEVYVYIEPLVIQINLVIWINMY
jgi:hypothetical protein